MTDEWIAPNIRNRFCDYCENAATVARRHLWCGHYFACADHDRGDVTTSAAACWHALMVSWPWGDDEPISGADVIDHVNSLRERESR